MYSTSFFKSIYPKKIKIVIILLMSLFTYAQKETKEIDSLVALTLKYNSTYEIEKLLDVSQKLVGASKKAKYEKGVVRGYNWIALCLMYTGNYVESNKYVKKAQSYHQYMASDQATSSRSLAIIATNHQMLGHYKLSTQNYHNALNVLKNQSKKIPKEFEPFERDVYANLSKLYLTMKMPDSALYYMNKKKEVSLEGTHTSKAHYYNSLGTIYTEKNELDSANYYYNKSLLIFKDKPTHVFKADAINGLGGIYFKQKNYEKALECYFKALEIFKNLNLNESIFEVYQSIGQAYKKLENFKEGELYSEKYKKFKDSSDISAKKQADFIINEVIKEEKQESENVRRNDLKKAAILTGILLIALATTLYFFRRSRNKTNEVFIKKQEETTQLLQKTEQLEQKVNDSFEEIIVLAKTNSPEFFTRFQEVYPDFRNKLLQVNSDLKTSELTLCAYIYLGFNTKDIAEYTFKAEKTVRNNKYNIRKRLDVPAKADFGIWLRNHTTS